MTGTDFDEGRYLYCAVAVPEEHRNTNDDEPGFDARGIDDEPVSVVSTESSGVGVVTHACGALYDTDDPLLLQEWLLQHQRVVDALGDRFGTPLPFRFDTILTGTDDTVRAWIDERALALSDHLEAFAGLWEYHVDIRTETGRFEADLADDERLQDLDDRIADASDGAGFLLQKQYGQRLAELERRRRAERIETLGARLGAHALEVRTLDVDPERDVGPTDDALDGSSTAEPETETESESKSAPEPTSERVLEARFALLAASEREAAIGDVLDEVAAEPGVEIRFTGPWPPYTFAPELDGEV